MTNPDREELVKLADEIQGLLGSCGGLNAAGHDRIKCKKAYGLSVALSAALRRLALSDGGVKGEPVAWRWRFEDKKYWNYTRREPDWKNDPDIVCEPLYTAPSADSGTREALENGPHYLGAIKQRLERLYEEHPNEPRLREHLSDEVDWIDGLIAALTAPGATTESDGGEPSTQMPETNAIDPAAVSKQPVSGASSSPAGHASSDGGEERQASNLQSQVTHGPSDPSSTRSEVTVEELARAMVHAVYPNSVRDKWFERDPVDLGSDRFSTVALAGEYARALLDQFEIRRRK